MTFSVYHANSHILLVVFQSTQQCADMFGLPYTGVIDRPDLQEILLDECQQIKPDFIKNGNPVVSYENKGKGKGVTVTLGDGTTDEADILVGSDGIWSAIRNQMYSEGGIKSTSKDGKRRQGCTYSGYTVFAGETVIKTADYYETGYKVYIGPKVCEWNGMLENDQPHTPTFLHMHI